jgi:aryl-alcohol dehydrogenase-like predicted oxidoreductase
MSEPLPRRRLGADGPDVSVLGLGTNNLGFRIGLDEARPVIVAALDEGVTLFDTADVYGAGESERLLGELLRGRRDEVVLLTKFGNTGKMPDAPEAPRGSPEYAHWALDGSLRRLQVDHVDIWMNHRPDDETPIAETVGAMAEAIRAGKARYAAVSNVKVAHLEEAAAAAAAEGIPLVAVENRYSVVSRRADADIVPAARRHGLSLLPYYPLESGLLTGRYRRGEAVPEDSRFAGRPDIWPAERWLDDEAFDRLEALEAVAAGAGATVLDLAIGGLAALPSIGSVIAGARTPEQVRANAAAARYTPDEATMAALASLPNAR